MGTAEKLLARLRKNPKGDWTMENLLTVAKRNGIEVRSSGGSHHVFSFPGLEADVTIPFRRPIKPIYITKFLALVDAIEEKNS